MVVSTSHNVLQSSLFWPTLFKDVTRFSKECDQCQCMGSISRKHKMPLNNILELDIFDVLEKNFMGPIPYSYGNAYILVAADYVSKWLEAIKLLANKSKVVVQFVEKKIHKVWNSESH